MRGPAPPTLRAQGPRFRRGAEWDPIGRGARHAWGAQPALAAVHALAAAVSCVRHGAGGPRSLSEGPTRNVRDLPPLDSQGRALLLPGGAAAGRVQEVNFRGAHWHFPGGIIILPFLESAREERPTPANFEVTALQRKARSASVPLRRWACRRHSAPRRSP